MWWLWDHVTLENGKKKRRGTARRIRRRRRRMRRNGNNNALIGHENPTHCKIDFIHFAFNRYKFGSIGEGFM